MSGYDIKKMVEVGLSYFWNVSYGQIFPVLNKLVDDGWATKRADPKSGGRKRQEYRATAKGRRAFQKWLNQPSGLPQLRDELKLKFFLTSRSPSTEGIRLLEEYGQQQRAHLDMLLESEVVLRAALNQPDMPEDLLELQDALGWEEKPNTGDHAQELLVFYLTLRSGVLVAEARVAWVAEVLPVMRAGKLPDL
ncbi:MAG: PadR family transcriptional regulator AphA [Candidatus Krumholzibacteriia bacterium]|jgi:PadR family transcriptional regulator AphA